MKIFQNSEALDQWEPSICRLRPTRAGDGVGGAGGANIIPVLAQLVVLIVQVSTGLGREGFPKANPDLNRESGVRHCTDQRS